MGHAQLHRFRSTDACRFGRLRTEQRFRSGFTCAPLGQLWPVGAALDLAETARRVARLMRRGRVRSRAVIAPPRKTMGKGLVCGARWPQAQPLNASALEQDCLSPQLGPQQLLTL
jgi:hypothetical protein